MYTCDQSTELFWDHLYGLLDVDQAQRLRQHLDACPGCQTALVQAETQQRLVARAARMYDMAPFQLPESELEPATNGADSVPHKTLPLPPRPVHGRRRWPWVAAAAALLLLVGGGYGWYRHGLDRRQQEFDQARQGVEDAQAQFADARREARRQARDLPAAVRAGQLHLKVLGPASYQAGAPSQYRVVTRDLNGAAAPARVTARVVSVSARGPALVLAEKHYRSRGDLLVSLPGDLKAPPLGTVRLEVEAQSVAVRELVRQDVRVNPPGFTTQLALDRAVYRTGDMLFFRTLTLGRFSRQPPAQELILVATLTDAAGTKIQHFGRIGKDGLGGGEFALTENLCEGECTLEVVENGRRFPRVLRHFLLVRGQAPQVDMTLSFEKSSYNPGDVVRVRLRARQVQGGAVANQMVTTILKLGAARRPGPATRTNDRGEASVVFPLPRVMDVRRASFAVRVSHGKSIETLEKPIPMAGSRAAEAAALGVEFFPEGGDLVAGLPTRVYFRARTGQGDPSDLEGSVVDGQGREVVPVRSKGQRGLGSFRITPRLGEVYTLRITALSGTALRPQLPEVRPAGVVLSVPAGVSRAGDPLRVTVQHRGPARTVVVAAFCRGRLVDQKAVVLGGEETEVALNPVAGAQGVVRVTVYQPTQGRLVPLVERLVYRLPARRLQMEVRADRPHYRPGERVTIDIRSANEKGAAAPAWLLASVVNEMALDGEPNGVAPYYLTAEIRRPEDLEEADVWVRDDAAAFAALDLFLGTQGWRRFQPPAGPAGAVPVVLGGPEALVLLDNSAPAKGQDTKQQKPLLERYREALKTAHAQLVEKTRRHTAALAEQKARRIGEEREAETALAQFEQLPGIVLRRALAGLVVLLLTVGCLALLLGLVRAVRGATANTPYFATAFGSLLACLLLVYANRHGGFAQDRRDMHRGPVELAREPQPRLDLPADAVALRLPNAVAQGQYVGLPRIAAGTQNIAVAARRRGTEGVRTTEKQDGPVIPADLQKRFAAMEKHQQTATVVKFPVVRPMVRPDVKVAVIGPHGKVPKEKLQVLTRVEYAHVHPRNGAAGTDLQETVLWSPALRAEDGGARVAFDLSDRATTFRILVHGHSQDGRQGVALERLESKP
jgi:hypothetical protein